MLCFFLQALILIFSVLAEKLAGKSMSTLRYNLFSVECLNSIYQVTVFIVCLWCLCNVGALWYIVSFFSIF